MDGPKTYKVLMVDDSDDDRFFLRRVLKRFPRFELIGELADGQQALAYLSGHEPYSQRQKHPLPDLLLLDLKMPRMTGFEVLHWLQTHSFPNLTIVVLSGSNLGEDIGASLALGAHGFWTKTASPDRQKLIAEEIETLLGKRWKQRRQPPHPKKFARLPDGQSPGLRVNH